MDAAVYIVDVELTPYTQYNYSVTASNSAGSLTSASTTATTHEAQPSELAAPNCQTYNDQLDTIQLFWSPVAVPNGLSVCLSSLFSSIKYSHMSHHTINLCGSCPVVEYLMKVFKSLANSNSVKSI